MTPPSSGQEITDNEGLFKDLASIEQRRSGEEKTAWLQRIIDSSVMNELFFVGKMIEIKVFGTTDALSSIKHVQTQHYQSHTSLLKAIKNYRTDLNFGDNSAVEEQAILLKGLSDEERDRYFLHGGSGSSRQLENAIMARIYRDVEAILESDDYCSYIDIQTRHCIWDDLQGNTSILLLEAEDETHKARLAALRARNSSPQR